MEKVEGSFVNGTAEKTIRIHKRVNFNIATNAPYFGQNTLTVSVQNFNYSPLSVYLLALVTHMVTVGVVLPNTKCSASPTCIHRLRITRNPIVSTLWPLFVQ